MPSVTVTPEKPVSHRSRVPVVNEAVTNYLQYVQPPEGQKAFLAQVLRGELTAHPTATHFKMTRQLMETLAERLGGPSGTSTPSVRQG